MFNDENVIYEEETVIPEVDYTEVETEESGVSKLVVAALTAAGAAVIGGAAWVGKKLWDKNKERKVLRRPQPKEETEEVTVVDAEIVDEANEE